MMRLLAWLFGQDEVGLPLACVPLWQEAQVPGWMPTWRKRAPEKLAVLWHSSHGCVVVTTGTPHIKASTVTAGANCSPKVRSFRCRPC